MELFLVKDKVTSWRNSLAPFSAIVSIFFTKKQNFSTNSQKLFSSSLSPRTNRLECLSRHAKVKTVMRLCHPPGPVPSISCCVLNHRNLFYHIQNALAFNRDMCCHLVLCLWLIPFHCVTLG
jgi:hypothetical protein